MPILEKGNRTEFPKGGRTAIGHVKPGLTISSGGLATITLGMALEEACLGFHEEFGRWPKWGNLVFRGGFTTNGAVVEICETD